MTKSHSLESLLHGGMRLVAAPHTDQTGVPLLVQLLLLQTNGLHNTCTINTQSKAENTHSQGGNPGRHDTGGKAASSPDQWPAQNMHN